MHNSNVRNKLVHYKFVHNKVVHNKSVRKKIVHNKAVHNNFTSKLSMAELFRVHAQGMGMREPCNYKCFIESLQEYS